MQCYSKVIITRAEFKVELTFWLNAKKNPANNYFIAERRGNEQKENEVETVIQYKRKRENVAKKGKSNMEKCKREKNKRRNVGWLFNGLDRCLCLNDSCSFFISASGGGDLWMAALSRPWAAPAVCPSSPARDLRTLTLCPNRQKKLLLRNLDHC